MRTHFTEQQLADPDTAESEKILRKCTHCGFCTATCPTICCCQTSSIARAGAFTDQRGDAGLECGAERRHR